jgi:hypothetical protein
MAGNPLIALGAVAPDVGGAYLQGMERRQTYDMNEGAAKKATSDNRARAFEYLARLPITDEASFENSKALVAKLDPELGTMVSQVTFSDAPKLAAFVTNLQDQQKMAIAGAKGQAEVGYINAGTGYRNAQTQDIGIDNSRADWKTGADVANIGSMMSDRSRRTDIYGANAYDQIAKRRDANLPMPVAGLEGGGGLVPEGPWQDVPDPTRFMRDPKAQDRFYTDQAKARTKQQEEEAAALAAADKNARLADEFIALNEKSETGGVYRAPVFGGVASDIGAMADPNINRMSAINAELTPGMRAPGSGATSDFDAMMFQRATLGIQNPLEANRSVAAGLKARQALTRERNSFNEAYYSAVGHLNGAEEAWANYLNANPIFDPGSAETPRLNPQRKSWREYYAVGRGNASAPAPTDEVDDLIKKYGGE